MRSRMPFQPDVLRVMLFDPPTRGRSLTAVRMHGRDAAPGGRVNVNGYALRLIDEDEQRMGRPRARSGAEKILRAAGFSEPGRAYAFAMDERARRRVGATR